MSQGLRLLQHELRQVKQKNTQLNDSVISLQEQLAAASERVAALEERLAALEKPVTTPAPKRRGRKKKTTATVDAFELPAESETPEA